MRHRRRIWSDFIEVSPKTKELGWSEGKSNLKCWLEKICDSDSSRNSGQGQCQKIELRVKATVGLLVSFLVLVMLG